MGKRLIEVPIEIQRGRPMRVAYTRSQKLEIPAGVEWFRPNIGGSEWRAIIAKRARINELKENDGYCLLSQRAMLVADDVGRELYRPIMFHEMGHASIWMAGLDKALRAALGIQLDKVGGHRGIACVHVRTGPVRHARA